MLTPERLLSLARLVRNFPAEFELVSKLITTSYGGPGLDDSFRMVMTAIAENEDAIHELISWLHSPLGEHVPLPAAFESVQFDLVVFQSRVFMAELGS